MTATSNDSLSRIFLPTPVDNPGVEFYGAKVSGIEHFYEKGIERYTEIQVHGQLAITDIEEFVINLPAELDQLPPEVKDKLDQLQQLADKWGIKLTLI